MIIKQVLPDGRDGLLRGAQMRTMARGVQVHQRAAGEVAVNELAHARGRDNIFGALQNQRRGQHARQILAIVGKERNPGKMPGDFRVRAAEALRQFRPQFGTLGIPHNRRRYGAGPTQVVAFERSHQTLNVGPVKAAGIAVAVDIAG